MSKTHIIIYRHQLFLPSETFITRQAEALQNFKPIYCGRTRNGTPMAQPVITLSKRHPWQYLSQALLRNQKTLAAKLRAFKPVLIHAHFGVEGVYALPLANALGIPLVTSFRGFDATLVTAELLRSRKVSWINYAFGKAALARRGDLFLCVSDAIRGKVIAMGFPEEKTITHYTGIDVDALQPVYHRDSSVVLHVARLVEKKGTRYLLQAFAQVSAAVPSARLVIIGDGPQHKALESLAQRLGIATRVTFLGTQDNPVVLDWMRKARVFCLPSVTARSGDAEGLPTTNQEAGALALPIVATWHSGNPELIRDGYNGYLVPEKDPAALAQRLIQFLRDPALCESMGKAGRRVIEERFNIRQQTRRLEELYQGLVR